MDIVNVIVCGGIASGKTEFCRYAARHFGGQTFSSDELFGKKGGREGIAETFDEAFAREGPGMVTDRMIAAFDERMRKGYDGPNVLYHGGLRHVQNLEHVKRHPRIVSHHLVWLEVDERTRFENYKRRDFFKGDSGLSFEDFRKLNDHPHEHELPALKSQAHSLVENVGLLADFHDAIDDVMVKLGFPKLRP